MTGWKPKPGDLERVNAETANWQQGDIFEGTRIPLLRVTSAELPLSRDPSDSASRIAADEHDLVAIVSQTCDVVRHCGSRPQLVIAPIVKPDDATAALAGRRRWCLR